MAEVIQIQAVRVGASSGPFLFPESETKEVAGNSAIRKQAGNRAKNRAKSHKSQSQEISHE
jgi:hypothetical protein